MAKNFSIVDLGDVSKPANTLIKVIANAIGVLYEPTKIRRKAKAEADANTITAINDIKIEGIQRRAMQRFLTEETNKQINIESITEKSLPHLNDDAKPQDIENDWIVNFFDKSKLISDDEMQNLWAKILAGEANNPGTFSKRTIEILSNMDKDDALAFEQLCSFRWFLKFKRIFIYSYREEIYWKNNITFSNLRHLDSIGLINFEPIIGFHVEKLKSPIYSSYFDIPICLKFEFEEKNLKVGQVLLTKSGDELMNIVNSKPIPGFVDYIIKKWSNHEGITSYSPYPRLEIEPNVDYGFK